MIDDEKQWLVASFMEENNRPVRGLDSKIVRYLDQHSDRWSTSTSPYFVRSWTQESYQQVFQLYLPLLAPDSRDSIEPELQLIADSCDCRLFFSAGLRTSLAGPLWNAGFEGATFEAICARLYEEATPILADLIVRKYSGAAALRSDLLDLMVAHMVMSVATSELMAISSVDAEAIVSLRLLSYRSHFEGFLVTTRSPAEVREHFDDRYSGMADGARRSLTKWLSVVEGQDSDKDQESPVAKWVGLVRRWMPLIQDCFSNGTIALVDQGVSTGGGPLANSSFHTTLKYGSQLEYFMNGFPEFLAVRLLTSLLYSSLYTVGLDLNERYFFCYVLARTNEEFFGQTSQELLQVLDRVAAAVYAQREVVAR